MDDARDGRGRGRRVNARARARRRARGERATVNEEEYPVRRLRVMNRAQLAVRENSRNAVSGRRRGRPRARALVSYRLHVIARAHPTPSLHRRSSPELKLIRHHVEIVRLLPSSLLRARPPAAAAAAAGRAPTPPPLARSRRRRRESLPLAVAVPQVLVARVQKSSLAFQLTHLLRASPRRRERGVPRRRRRREPAAAAAAAAARTERLRRVPSSSAAAAMGPRRRRVVPSAPRRDVARITRRHRIVTHGRRRFVRAAADSSARRRVRRQRATERLGRRRDVDVAPPHLRLPHRAPSFASRRG